MKYSLEGGSKGVTKRQLYDNIKNNTYARLQKSKIHGTGVIAIKNIPKGVDPFKKPGNSCYRKRSINITKKETMGLNPSVRKMLRDFITPEDDGSFYVPEHGLNSIDISFFMNHSENNNIDIVDDGCEFLGFRTNRPIKKGEELTINYRYY